LLAQGLEKAGKPVDGDNLRDELLRVKTFALVGGAGSFDDKGDISMAIDVKQLKGGKLVKIA
jgi:branched-chain amino acid transport system substrate-binding protein